MIQLSTIQQQIVITGTTDPEISVVSLPEQTITLEASGPRGPTGPKGDKGDQGPAGNVEDLDLPDFTLIFDNNLI